MCFSLAVAVKENKCSESESGLIFLHSSAEQFLRTLLYSMIKDCVYALQVDYSASCPAAGL